MFSKISDFLNRHRRKLIVSGVVVGGVALATRYAQRKLREWQERETTEFLERTRRQQHFESTERTCNQTALSLAPSVHEAIARTLDTEDLLVQLRTGPSDKVLLWEELKILAFTRASVLVYSGAMFVVALRIQLNVIGGHMYRDSTEETSRVGSALQQRYLSLCQHFVETGVQELCALVREKVRLVVGETPLKRPLTLRETEQMFWAIQAAVAGEEALDPVRNLACYLLPAEYPQDCELLREMTGETAEVLNSAEVSALTASCVSRGFSQLLDRIAEYFFRDELQLEQHSVTLPMAKLIPIVTGLVKQQSNEPGPWLQHLVLDDKLKLLGANVYEAFSQKG